MLNEFEYCSLEFYRAFMSKIGRTRRKNKSENAQIIDKYLQPWRVPIETPKSHAMLYHVE